MKDMGAPLLCPVCFEARINWGGQAEVLCSLFYSQFLLSPWMWVGVMVPKAAASPHEQFPQ